MALNLRSLIARLNTTTRGAMEGAAGPCMSRGHHEVEVELHEQSKQQRVGAHVDLREGVVEQHQPRRIGRGTGQ